MSPRPEPRNEDSHSAELDRSLQALIDSKTKPVGSLGRIEGTAMSQDKCSAALAAGELIGAEARHRVGLTGPSR